MFTIFLHELKQYLRDVRLQSFVFFAFLVMAGFLCLLWPESDVFSVIRASGRHIFSIILLLNLAIILAFVPALCACSVSDEKEKNRFVMLITTMLKPGDIMFGKLFAKKKGDSARGPNTNGSFNSGGNNTNNSQGTK